MEKVQGDSPQKEMSEKLPISAAQLLSGVFFAPAAINSE
jgi:hypothetical protein